MRAARPDLAPIDQPPALGLGRAGRGGKHVGPRIRLAEADAEAQLAAGDLRQDLLADLLLAAVRREGAGLDLLAQEGADLLAQFLGLGRQLDRVEAEAETHRYLTSLG